MLAGFVRRDMWKGIKIVIVFTLCLLTVNSYGQRRHSRALKSNCVRISGGQALMGNLMVNYEKGFKSENSVVFSGRYKFNSELKPIHGLFVNQLSQKITPLENAYEFKHYTGTLEYRSYSQKRKRRGGGRKKRSIMNGFYTGPFISYNYYEFLSDINIGNVEYNTQVTITNFGLGFQIGKQVNFGNGLSMDWTVIGLGGSWNQITGTLVAQGKNELTVQEQVAATSRIENFSTDIVFRNKPTPVSISGNVATSTLSHFFGLVRAQISFGFIF